MATELSESIALMLAEAGAARHAAWEARRKRKASERAAFKAARDAGLIQRYAQKTARIKQRASIT